MTDETARGVAHWLAAFQAGAPDGGRLDAALATARALSDAAARESAALALEDEPGDFTARLAARAAK